MSKTILYLVFGNKREFQLELTYSILSAVKFPRTEKIRIALVCDAANARSDIPVENVVIPDSQLSGWLSEYKFAAKAHALNVGMEKFGGSVALIDTDTKFIGHPNRLFERVGHGRSVMHAEEGILNDHSYWHSLLKKLDGPVGGHDISSRSRIMNSGVVALHEADKAAIPVALKLMTALCEVESVFNIEQFAFTAALGQRGTISTCKDIVWHYWGHNRRFAHAQLEKLFPDFSAAIYNGYMNNLPAIGMPRVPFAIKLKARLVQLTQQCNDDYRFAYIAALCALEQHNNEWTEVALDILEHQQEFPAALTRDFRQYRGIDLENKSWMGEPLRLRWRAFWASYEQSDAVVLAKS